MWRRTSFRLTSSFLCIAVAAAVQALPPGPSLAPRSHGFMLYLSQPLGGGGGSIRPKFGFRIEQVRMTGNNGAPDAGDPMQHRALVGWQMDGLSGIKTSNMRVELGGRMTYDVAHGSFALQTARSPAYGGPRPVSQSARQSAGVTESKPFESRLSERVFEPAFPNRETYRGANESSLAHDIAAAAIATFKSSRPAAAAAQQRAAVNQRSAVMRDLR